MVKLEEILKWFTIAIWSIALALTFISCVVMLDTGIVTPAVEHVLDTSMGALIFGGISALVAWIIED